MKVNPNIYVHFNGQCEAAFKCYEECLNGTISFMLTYGNSPSAADAPPGWNGKVFHATLKVGDTVVQGADVPPNAYEAPKGFDVALQMDDSVAAERAFQALSENGTIKMPLQETFWAGRFGMLVDRFGIPWSINCAKGAVEPTP